MTEEIESERISRQRAGCGARMWGLQGQVIRQPLPTPAQRIAQRSCRKKPNKFVIYGNLSSNFVLGGVVSGTSAFGWIETARCDGLGIVLSAGKNQRGKKNPKTSVGISGSQERSYQTVPLWKLFNSQKVDPAQKLGESAAKK